MLCPRSPDQRQASQKASCDDRLLGDGEKEAACTRLESQHTIAKADAALFGQTTLAQNHFQAFFEWLESLIQGNSSGANPKKAWPWIRPKSDVLANSYPLGVVFVHRFSNGERGLPCNLEKDPKRHQPCRVSWYMAHLACWAEESRHPTAGYSARPSSHTNQEKAADVQAVLSSDPLQVQLSVA